MDDKLAVLTTNINPPVLSDFITSINKQRSKQFHVFIVDISGQSIRPTDHSSYITVLKSENKGFAHGVDIALREALRQGFTKFCLVNDDTFFDEKFVEHVLTSIKNHPSVIIGGKIFYAPGYEYHKEKYKKEDLGKVIWFAGGTFDWDHVLTKHRGVDEVDRAQFDTFEEVEFASGALMFFDKAVVDAVGLWDESYFLYFEDADYCVRAAKHGVRIYYDPSVVVWHKVSQSTGGSGSSLHVRYQTKNRLKFGLKYAPFKTKLHLMKNFIFDFFKK